MDVYMVVDFVLKMLPKLKCASAAHYTLQAKERKGTQREREPNAQLHQHSQCRPRSCEAGLEVEHTRQERDAQAHRFVRVAPKQESTTVAKRQLSGQRIQAEQVCNSRGNSYLHVMITIGD